jgi:hypothetical protein
MRKHIQFKPEWVDKLKQPIAPPPGAAEPALAGSTAPVSLEDLGIAEDQVADLIK